MTPLIDVWPYGIVFWAAFVWAYWPEFRIVRSGARSAKQAHSQDAGSVRVIMYGSFLAYVIGVPLSAVRALRFPASAQVAAFVAGLLLLVAGSLLRRHCWRMLGASFTGDVRAHADQQVVTQVVTRGAYALLRHPSYTAGVLMHTGFGVALGSWGSALAMTAITFATYLYRMRVEERTLLAAIGEPYRDFLRTRKRLIPFVY